MPSDNYGLFTRNIGLKIWQVQFFIADKNAYNGNFSPQFCNKLKTENCLSKEIFIP